MIYTLLFSPGPAESGQAGEKRIISETNPVKNFFFVINISGKLVRHIE